MSEGNSPIEQGASQGGMRFEPTKNGGHRILMGQETLETAAPAFLRAAFSKSKPMPLAGQVGGYKGEIDQEQAQKLFEQFRQDGNPYHNNLFFVEYAHGKNVNVGANRLPDGSIELVDKEGKPIPEAKAKAIFEDAEYLLEEAREENKP